MPDNLLSTNSEFFIFFIFEFLLIMGFIIFYRHSRNNGGVFDRRIESRRAHPRRWNDHSIPEFAFEKSMAESSEIIEIFNDRTDQRRTRERRRTTDRRHS